MMANVKTTVKRPEKFHHFIKIIVYGFKIFGLAPFSLKARNLFANFGTPVCICSFSFSKIGMVYNLLMAMSIAIVYVLLIPKVPSAAYELKSKLTSFCDVAQSSVAIATVLTIIVSWTFKQSNAVTIMNRLTDADLRLFLKKGPNIRGRLTLAVVHWAINVFLCIALIVTQRNNVPSYFVLTNPPSILISFFITEYFLVVGILRMEFHRVNKMLSSCKDFRCVSHSISFLSSESEISDFSNHRQLSALRSLRSTRTMLFEITNDVAKFFSFPILMCIGHSYVTLLHYTYWTIIPVLGSNGGSLLARVAQGSNMLLVVLYPVIILVHNVTKTIDEAKLTGLVVHELMATTAIPEIKAELEEFSLRILHEELNFTAYGFVQLDFTLLHSMVASLVTYLVILIQFSG